MYYKPGITVAPTREAKKRWNSEHGTDDMAVIPRPSEMYFSRNAPTSGMNALKRTHFFRSTKKIIKILALKLYRYFFLDIWNTFKAGLACSGFFILFFRALSWRQ